MIVAQQQPQRNGGSGGVLILEGRAEQYGSKDALPSQSIFFYGVVPFLSIAAGWSGTGSMPTDTGHVASFTSEVATIDDDL